MALYRYPSSSQAASKPVGITEFEILKASHKFLREEEERPTTWDEKLAEKYYTSLYREFAVCDLKHYKSGNFALRWRTEEEVLDGSGETTCGNTRCEHHFPSRLQNEEAKPALTTLELPFTYVEHGESKSALVKVILCGRCVEKLMWKHNKEKEKRRRAEEEAAALHDSQHPEEEEESMKSAKNKDENDRVERHRQKKRSRETIEERERSHKRRTSRSISPQQRHKDGKSAKRRSFHSRSHET